MRSPDQLSKLRYAEPGESAAAFQRIRTCALSVPDVATLLLEGIEAADLWILHEIDLQMLLRWGGYAISPAREILFFHPRFMARLLVADPAAFLEVPLKFAILELADGGVVTRWADPAAAFARYQNPALADLGRELAQICDEIVARALGPSPTPS